MLELFQFEFIRRGFAAGLILAVCAPLIGSFLVARRYSLLADTLAHVSLLGVALGLLIQVNPLLSALAVSLLAAWAIEALRERQGEAGDSLLAIFLWGGLAGAVVLISLAQGFQVNLFGYLFGDIAGVQPNELYLIAGLGGLVSLSVWLFRRQLFALALDEDLARASGINARLYNRILVLLAALTVSLAARVLGVLLVGALMVIPFAAASHWAQGFRRALALSLVFSVLSVVLGLLASYQYNLAPGGAIVLAALGFYLSSTWRRR
ncbi:MAG: metal ABC transporter permease [bacterium]|nr:metal ABC transporter permease [bacterium]